MPQDIKSFSYSLFDMGKNRRFSGEQQLLTKCSRFLSLREIFSFMEKGENKKNLLRSFFFGFRSLSKKKTFNQEK